MPSNVWFNFSPHLFNVLTLPCETYDPKNHDSTYPNARVKYVTVINSQILLCFLMFILHAISVIEEH